MGLKELAEDLEKLDQHNVGGGKYQCIGGAPQQ